MSSEIPDLDAASALIRHRRSIKPAQMEPGKEVPPELVDRLLENASWAPTHGMTQPWRFTVFTGGARAELGAELQRIYDLIVPADQVRPDKRAKMLATPQEAAAVITVGMVLGAPDKIPEHEEIAAVACAVQNLHLSACAAGLAGYWSSPPPACSEEFARYLGLPVAEGARSLGLFYLGWPGEGMQWPPGNPRRPLSDFVTRRGDK